MTHQTDTDPNDDAVCVDDYPEHDEEVTYEGSDGVGWRCRRCDAEGWDPAEGEA